MEAVDVNVVGSQNVARVAIELGIEAVIGVSTDKAAPPVRNTYGLTKALMERMFCSMNGKTRTQFMCVRYGNVAWSTGSVLPIWNDMHRKTGVIGTTGPHMTRFFFTVEEAVALISTALAHLQDFQGKVLSRLMKAAQIEDILKIWIREKGGRWEVIAGRPGERDQEYLIGSSELPYAQERMIDGVKHYIIGFNEKVSALLADTVNSDNVERLTEAEIRNLISNLPAHERPE
jgi:UDP-N-acetylglucosamine 4,6-dehydratase